MNYNIEIEGAQMYRLIIFDVDGTLIDTENAVTESYQYAIAEEFGRRFTGEELSVAYGIPTTQAMERLGIRDIEKALKRYFENLFKAFAESVGPFPGVAELLVQVENLKLRCGIVTSRNRSEVSNDPSLQKLIKYFQYIVCVEDTEKHKPEAEPILKLVEWAGRDVPELKLSEVLYLGDTYYDYRCARNAGVAFALAAWGARRTNGIEADYVLGKPVELLSLLKSHC